MSKILILNNYDLSWFGEMPAPSPDHFLYGVNYLHQRGDKIVVFGARRRRLLSLIEEMNVALRLHVPIGDLSQQWEILPEVRAADLIYSPCDSVAHTLCYLRAAGIIKIPIVCLAHHPPLQGFARFIRLPWVKLALRGVSAFPSLSSTVAEQINKLAADAKLSTPLAWGPDLDYYPSYRPGRKGVITAGRTGRDFVTFGRAASRTACPATIVCPSRYVVDEFRQFSSNVAVLSHQNEMHFGYRELIQMYAESQAIAIPMAETSGLCGLTSLLDALAMGRAVISTRNALIDIDIESEGIGFTVAPGDIDGWEQAIRYIQDHPDEAEAMGHRARQLAEQRCNSRLFATSLLKIIDRVLESSLM